MKQTLSQKKVNNPNPFPKISALIRNKLHTAFLSSLLLHHTHSTLYLQQVYITIYVTFKTPGERKPVTGGFV